MVKELQNIMKYDDVMTVIFSDHGNKFAHKYIRGQFPEGSIDTTHPALFVILPKKEKKYFTAVQLEALEVNQNALFTAMDMHYLFAKLYGQKFESTLEAIGKHPFHK